MLRSTCPAESRSVKPSREALEANTRWSCSTVDVQPCRTSENEPEMPPLMGEVIVYVVFGDAASAVPVIEQLVLSRESPCGSCGVISQLVISVSEGRIKTDSYFARNE